MKKHVLVIDDDRDIRISLREYLEDEMFEVDTAGDGLDALEHIIRQQERYHVILLDLTMPRMNGLQLLQVLQQQKEAVLPSIIVLSADQSALQQAIGLGIGHSLAKPFDLDTLLELIDIVTSNPSRTAV